MRGKYGTAHAAHDLNDVHTVDIAGWTGEKQIVAGDSAWVEIAAPKRHPDEYWTFQRQRDGVLRCHSSLIGSPRLLTDRDPQTGQKWVMTIEVPTTRLNNLHVRTR